MPVILQAKITMYNQEKNGPVAEPTPIPDTDLNSGSLTIAVKHRQTSTVQLKTPKPNQQKKNLHPTGLNKILLYSEVTRILKSRSLVLADNI